MNFNSKQAEQFYSWECLLTHRVSPSGKAQDFDSCIRRFKSYYPSFYKNQKYGADMVRVDKIQHFSIFQSDDGYVVVNNRMPRFAHSHINNYRTAKWICELSLKKQLPHDIPKYLLISLLRINDDEIYCQKIKELLKAKSKKKDMYFNSNKGVRKK